jgi:3-oxoacyl-[acyl-carrier-protein] synthase-1
MRPLAVLGSGAVTAVGFNAPATWAAIRAKVSGTRVDNLWDPSGAEYMAVARPRTPQWWEGADLLGVLAASAVSECLDILPPEIDRASIPVLLLLEPEDRPWKDDELPDVIAATLAERLGYPLPSGSATLAGRGKLLPAMLHAEELLTSHKSPFVVIVGVDTFLRQHVINEFIEQRRVLTTTNSNGFIPGEAACAVVLGLAGRAPAGELRVVGYGHGLEPGTIESDAPLTGDGLTDALRMALSEAGITMAQTNYWLTDQNGEHYKAKECTIAQIRLERRDRPAPKPYQIWHPIQQLGEIGSAIGPGLLGLASAAAAGGFAPGPIALLTVGEDDGERSAFVLAWTMETA